MIEHSVKTKPRLCSYLPEAMAFHQQASDYDFKSKPKDRFSICIQPVAAKGKIATTVVLLVSYELHTSCSVSAIAVLAVASVTRAMVLPSYIQGNRKARGMSIKYNGTFVSRTYYSTCYGQKLH